MTAKKANLIKYSVALAAMAVIILADQWTKQLARTNLKDGPYAVWEGVLEFYYYENRGAVWGILQGQTIFLSVFTIIIMAALIFCYIRIPLVKKYYPMLCINICIMGGAIGNFIDRVMNHYVTDFIYFKLIDFPIFNVADIFVTVSAVTMLVLAFTLYRNDEWEFLSFDKKPKAEEAED